MEISNPLDPQNCHINFPNIGTTGSWPPLPDKFPHIPYTPPYVPLPNVTLPNIIQTTGQLQVVKSDYETFKDIFDKANLPFEFGCYSLSNPEIHYTVIVMFLKLAGFGPKFIFDESGKLLMVQ